LLLSSVAGAVWVVHIRAEDDPAGLPDVPAPHSNKPVMQPDGVVCRGEVSVDGKVFDLYPMIPGEIAEIPVTENQLVKKGAVLLKIDDRKQLIDVRKAEAALQAAKAELENAKKKPQSLQAQIAIQQQKIAAAAAEKSAAQFKVDYLDSLFKKNLANDKELEGARSLLNAADANWKGQQEALNLLKIIDPTIDIDKASANVRAQEAMLDEARLALNHCTLSAPEDGMVLRIQTAKGEVASFPPGPPAIRLCPNTPRIVRVEVEQEYAGRVKEGMPVVVLDEISVSAKWKGKVRRVGDYFSGKRNPEPLAFNDLRTIEAIVELDPGQPSLKIGQKVRVVIGAIPQR
jgi:multidrug resistance efflux pump